MNPLQIHVDLGCEACGYNLRGLTLVDEIRCPECGARRLREWVTHAMTARLQSGRIADPSWRKKVGLARRTIAAPLRISYAAIVSAPLVLFAWSFLGDARFGRLLLTVIGIAWLFGLALFILSTVRSAGRLHALLGYHIFIVPFAAIHGALGMLLLCLVPETDGAAGPLVIPLIFGLPFILAAIEPTRFLNRRAYKSLLPLIVQKLGPGFEDVTLDELMRA